MVGIQRLFELIHDVVSETDLERLLDRTLAAAMEVSRAERGFVILMGPPIEVRASRRLDGGQVCEARRKISRTVLERVAASRRPLVLRDGELMPGSVREQQVRSICALPLRTSSGAVGAVYLDQRSERGAFPAEELELLSAIGQQAAIALEHARLREEHRRHGSVPLPANRSPLSLVGASPSMRRIHTLIHKFAPLPYPVLLQGESGTGKELVARALHETGPRASYPFLPANVAAVPAPLFESEMFGHVRGAFTGADQDRRGLFEQAGQGTLFLDEINSLPLGLQEKLLRVLQEGEVRPVGASRNIPVKVRLVAASNESLETPPFRRDLFHRLNVLRIDVPPLRERREDIPPLAEHFLDGISAETGRRWSLSSDALDRLGEYAWPGNVRELENLLRRACALADREVLEAEDFAFLETSIAPSSPLLSLRDYVKSAISSHAPEMPLKDLAARLGVSRKTLWAMRRRFGIA